VIPSRINGEWWGVAAGVIMAGVGWYIHSNLLALVGLLIALMSLLLRVWQRECLTGVTYRRTVFSERALFGEQVRLDVEIVNDKLLPLTWLHIDETVPSGLPITGATLTTDDGGLPRVQHLMTMLPFQRVRRHLTITCERRGEHTFGPVMMRSGNPLGYRQESTRMRDLDRLLIYPKLFRLSVGSPASRVPLGDEQARLHLIEDPSRPVGVREYRPGDPIRNVDWRATARSTGLLVRVFEPTAATRVAVFADFRFERNAAVGDRADIAEFAIAITASTINEFAGRDITTGLYSSATVGGWPIALAPSSAPSALPAMLEQLARCAPTGRRSIADVLLSQVPQLSSGSSVTLVATDFDESTVAAIAEARRRVPVTVLWVASDCGRPPPARTADLRWEVTYDDDWKGRTDIRVAE
jgi:Protein of unknown function DUF58